MLKCLECGATNNMGRIFCHSCGAKLDLHNVKPVKGKRAFSLRKLIRPLVSLLILAAVIGVFAGFFMPVEVNEELPSETLQKKLWMALQHVLNNETVEEGETFRLDSAGVTYLARRITALEKSMADDSSGALAPQAVFVQLLPRNNVKVVVRYSVFNKLTTDAVVMGRLYVKGDSPAFEVLKAKIGRVPMPGPLQGIAVGRVASQFEKRSELSGLQGKTKSITIDRDELVFEPVARSPKGSGRKRQSSRAKPTLDTDVDLGGTSL
jgi:hypothetical protein